MGRNWQRRSAPGWISKPGLDHSFENPYGLWDQDCLGGGVSIGCRVETARERDGRVPDKICLGGVWQTGSDFEIYAKIDAS